MMENVVPTEALQLALNRHSEIREACPIIRKDMDNRPVVVAYVVPASISPPAAMAFTLKDFLADFHHPDLDNALPQAYADALNGISLDTVQIVLLNALPRDQHGSIDENALFALPVLDTGLIENWSRAIRKLSTIEDAVVLATLAHRKPGSLHRNDILKGLDPEGEAAVLAESSHVETEQPRANNLPDEETPEPGKKAKAIVHAAGQVLTDRLDEHHDLNLTSMLRRAAEQSPEKGIVYIDAAGDEQFQPYPQLLQEAETMLAGLLAQGIKAGDKVLLQCEDNRDFLNVFWACILGAMVPVPLSIAPDYTLDNAVVQKLFNVWQSLDQPVVVCSDNLTDEIIRVAAQLGGSSAAMAKKLLGVKSLQQHGKNTDRATCPGIEQPPGQLTLLLLTSGSTGTPKAVMHTHQTLINRCAATSVANHFGPEDISLNWMPLDHVGGIVMFHLRDVYNTCQQIQVATSWVLEQPLRWLDIIEDKHATVSWAPNFAYALIVDQATTLARQQRDLSSMRFFLNGGEPVVPRTASLFLKLLEPHQLAGDSMHPAWGMSETASAACYSDHFSTGSVTAAGAFVAVGAPIPNTAIRIVDRNNQVLNEGEKGNLQVKGASVTPGYYRNEEANRKAFTDDGWLDTGDAGIISHGQLTIVARIKDEIIINGVNYPAAELEAIAEMIDGVEVSYTAACAVRQTGSDTDALAVFFSPEAQSGISLDVLLQSIQTTIAARAGIKPAFIIPLPSTAIPKTNIGKIQRSLLKARFEQGEFDTLVRQSEQLLGINVIPDWFYRKTWQAKNRPFVNPDNKPAQKCWLIFSDASGFAERLCAQLTKNSATVVRVSAGSQYKCADTHAYSLAPDNAEHYNRLMQALQQSGIYPDSIVHCWSYVSPIEKIDSNAVQQAQANGVFSLLGLLKALSMTNTSGQAVSLHVVSSHIQQCTVNDKHVSPHAGISGLLKTAPMEFDWLTAQHVDFSFHHSPTELASQVDALLQEINSQGHDAEVAYRDNQRYSWQLMPADFTAENLQSSPIKNASLVLVTGGLGGIGASLAIYLHRHFNARLILTGRTALPAREEWPAMMAGNSAMAERLTRYLEIEALGTDFIYAAVDVTDAAAMEDVVKRAEQQWGCELAGIFHLAVGGEIASRWQDDSRYRITHESIDAYEAMFATKVYASWELAILASRRQQAFMVSFGSVIGVFGAAGYASYASAHTALSQMTAYFNRQYPGRFFQCDWAVWENIGLSAQEPAYALDYYQSIGYSLIPVNTGLDCLMAVLCHSQAELVIGLDADKWPIRQHLPFEGNGLQKLVACFTAQQPEITLESTEQIILHDRFNVPTQCEFMQMETLPRSTDGTPDLNVLQSLITTAESADAEQPESELEKQLAGMWCDVLQISRPGRHHSFFQYGGNSLNATQLLSRIKQQFGVRLPMRDLFDAATIAEMAALIARKSDDAAVTTESQSMNDSPEPQSSGTIDADTAQQLLENIDQLSDAQVAALLEQIEQGTRH